MKNIHVDRKEERREGERRVEERREEGGSLEQGYMHIYMYTYA